eukprot:jgi/Orpsp1_1/1175542/evm.model.c7180000054264.1
MKLISAIVFTVLNFCLVLSTPLKHQFRDDFNLLVCSVTDKTVDISGVGKNNINKLEVNIPRYFIIEGERYTVNSVTRGAFSGARAETVIFDYNPNEISIIDTAFTGAKYLKKVVFNTYKVKIDANAFNTNNINFDGRGVPSIVNDEIKKLILGWKLPFHDSTIDAVEHRDDKKTALYKLAKNLNSYLNTHGGYYDDQLLNILIFRRVGHKGMALLFRKMAMAMGVDKKYILAVSDNHCSFWNYVRFDRDKWYDMWEHMDAHVYDFNFGYDNYKGDKYPTNFFMTQPQYVEYFSNYVNKFFVSDLHNHPEKWYVLLAEYGTDYENAQNSKMLIDDYMKLYNLGGYRD